MLTIAELDRSNATEIDLAGAVFKANPRKHLAEWAARPPFYVFNNGPPQVIVGRYRDVHEVFTDPVRFSSCIPKGPGYEQFDKFMGSQFMTQMDGEQHARLRRLLMPAFSNRGMARLETRIAASIESMLDDIARGPREFDAMNDYAARLVIGVLLTAMLNLDAKQSRALLDLQETMPLLTAVKAGESYPPACIAAYERTAQVVRDVIAARRAHPRADFLGDLVAARDNEDRLSDVELFDMIFGIFGALATTPRSGSGAIHLIYTHTDQLAQLIRDPALIPEAVEECLRLAGNGYFTFPRIATRDTAVGGTPIPRGMIVRPSPQAANYDATIFADPLRFDIHRKPQRIMTFGAGPHHCIGNLLGRKTLVLAIERLLARFPMARLADPGFVPVYGGAAGELRMKSLPMLRE